MSARQLYGRLLKESLSVYLSRRLLPSVLTSVRFRQFPVVNFCLFCVAGTDGLLNRSLKLLGGGLGSPSALLVGPAVST